MTMSWVRKFQVMLEQKRRYRKYKTCAGRLPADYRTAIGALDRYLIYYGSIAKGDVLVSMLEDLLDLFQQGAAQGSSIRAIVGEDPVTFAETFLENYAEGQWVNKERERLTTAIDQLTAQKLA